jgi:hypothetical protein
MYGVERFIGEIGMETLKDDKLGFTLFLIEN